MAYHSSFLCIVADFICFLLFSVHELFWVCGFVSDLYGVFTNIFSCCIFFYCSYPHISFLLPLLLPMDNYAIITTISLLLVVLDFCSF